MWASAGENRSILSELENKLPRDDSIRWAFADILAANATIFSLRDNKKR
jgi:hypothetical protein